MSKFKYLGSVITDEGSKPEIISRIAQTTAAMTRLKPIWKDKSVTLRSKIRLMRLLVMSIFLYACEIWNSYSRTAKTSTSHVNEVLSKDPLQLIQYHITNEEVHNIIKQAIRPYEDLLTMVKRRKLKWFGHVSRIFGMTKTILQGTAREARRRGRQRKRWEDNIKEWTRLDFSDTQRAVDDMKKWKQLVARSSVVPQRHYGLRD